VQEPASPLGAGDWPGRREIDTTWVANTMGELDPPPGFLVVNPNSCLGLKKKKLTSCWNGGSEPSKMTRSLLEAYPPESFRDMEGLTSGDCAPGQKPPLRILTLAIGAIKIDPPFRARI
jgi:hypothetical protein